MFKKLIQKNTLLSNKERTAFFFLLTTLLSLGALYGVLLGETVSNVSKVTSIKSDLMEISSELSELEFEYMKYKNKFTLEYSRSFGMTEVLKLSYVRRDASSRTLTLVE